jgi:hypothetical protein
MMPGWSGHEASSRAVCPVATRPASHRPALPGERL